MGNTTVKFEQNQESPDGTGQLSALSNPVDGVTPEKFWDALKDFLKNRKIQEKYYEVAYEAWDNKNGDGSICTRCDFQSSGMARAFMGDMAGSVYTVYYIWPEKDEMRSYCYKTDETMSPQNLTTENVLKAWRDGDSFRFEFYMLDKPARLHGPYMQGSLKATLKNLGYDVECYADVDSPVEEGKKSAMSAPIEDPELTLETYWQKIKKEMVDKYKGEVLPNGKVVIETSGGMISSTTFATIGLNEAKDAIMTQDHGVDDTLQDAKGWHCTRVHSDPTRVETSYTMVEGRDSAFKAASVADEFVSEVFKHSRGES